MVCRRDEILEARAKRDARRAARGARNEEEALVDVGVGGDMDEEDSVGAAAAKDDAAKSDVSMSAASESKVNST